MFLRFQVAATALLITVVVGGNGAPALEKPNILFFLSDDQGNIT